MAEAGLNDDPIYVAVSKNVGDSKSTLLWALRNLQVKKLFLLHVHQQILMNPSSSGLEQSEIDAIQDLELKSSFDSLHKFRDICEVEGVNERDVDISCKLANNVEEGIVELIYENNIKKLVMGAAADSHYTEEMVHITSRKAEYVSGYAPHCCKIWLVCNGNLIETRKGRFDRVDSLNSSSSSSSSSLPGALIPYGGEPQRAEHDTQSPLSVLYNEEVTRRREVEEELNKAKAEIEEMKRIQKELKEERDEAVMTTQELLSCLNLENSPLLCSVSNEPPPYFICPISQEVMREPHFAADGFTYEAEAIREWLDNDHKTSPMTNVKLDHNNLVPNHSLRSAIQDWLQRNS